MAAQISPTDWPDGTVRAEIARIAYAMADAMLVERTRSRAG
jgi:hypothetical protein